VHRVDEAAARVGPSPGSFGAEGILCVTVKDSHVGIEVGIAGQVLALAVDEELGEGEAGGNFCLEDSVAVRLPFQLQLCASA